MNQAADEPTLLTEKHNAMNHVTERDCRKKKHYKNYGVNKADADRT